MGSGSHRWDAIEISDSEHEAAVSMERNPRKVLHRSSMTTMLGNTFSPSIGSLQPTDWRDLQYENPLNILSQYPGINPLRSDIPSSGMGVIPASLSDFNSGQNMPEISSVVLPGHTKDPCPYYHSTKFDLKMYCGPGSKKFHTVFNSLGEHHKRICDEWDKRQSQLNEPAQFLSCDILEQTCLEQTLAIFPQIEHEFVRKLFKENYSEIADGTSLKVQAIGEQVSQYIIAQIVEMESFPRVKNLKRKRSPTPQDDEDKPIPWDREMPRNNTYYKESLIILADEFTRIPTHFLHKALLQKKTLYDSFQFLAESEEMYNHSSTKPYSRCKVPRKNLEKKYQRRASEQREMDQYIKIVNEFQAARQRRFHEETRGKKQKADEEEEARNFAEHELQGSLIDCGCCFSETPINRVVNCENDDIHFFCHRCINARASERIGSMRHEMTCMDISGCGAELSKEALERALPLKITDKLAEIQQIQWIKAASLDGLEQCPFCDFQAICLAVEVDSIFQCLNPSCETATCRRCKKESHLPRTCEEEKKATEGLSTRHAIEEARSEAMMRPCPKCKVKIIKSDGCNKMTCMNCHAVMCYVCKADITTHKYQHFQQQGATCPLSDPFGHERHRRDADAAEKMAIVAAKSRDAEVDENELRIGASLDKVVTTGRGTGKGNGRPVPPPPPPPPAALPPPPEVMLAMLHPPPYHIPHHIPHHLPHHYPPPPPQNQRH